MKFYTELPRDDPNLHNQKQLTELSDKDFHALFEPIAPSVPLRILRFVLFCVFLGPLKIFFTVFFFTLYYIVVSFLPLFRKYFKTTRDFKNWAFIVCRPIVRAALFCTGVVKVNIFGEIHQDARTYVSNHLSLVESIILLNQFPLCYVAASYLAANSFSQRHSRVFDVVFVDRSKHQNISQQLCDIANDPMLLPVVVFPEGKVTNGEALVGFRSGAYISETLVQAIAIRYRMWLTPKNMATVSWNENNFKLYIYQLFSIPFMTVDLHVLPPINWKGQEKTPKEKAMESELQIANCLGTLANSLTNKDLFHGGETS